MIADIASNKTGAADVVFLIAVVLAVVAAATAARPVDARTVALGWLAVALVAFGLLLL